MPKDIRLTMTEELNGVMHTLPSIIQHRHVSSEETDDSLIENYIIEFEYGNLTHTHRIMLAYNIEADEYGIDLHSSDGDLSKITPLNIMTQLYFDLAMKELDEKYFE